MPEKKCIVCGTILTKKDFTCPRCGRSYCKLHVGTNIKYTCSKCGQVHSQEIALKFNERCPVIPQSSCPHCSSRIRLDKLIGGQYYLVCDECGWNSLDYSPLISYLSQSIVLNEGVHAGLLKKARTCLGRLKKKGNLVFCPHCLMDYIKSMRTVSFSTVAARLQMNEDEIVDLFQWLMQDFKFSGIIDKQNKFFTYIDESLKRELTDQVKSTGYISIDELMKKSKTKKEQALSLMFDIIRNERFHGTFDKFKEMYYTSKYLKDLMKKVADKEGIVDISELEKKLNVQGEILRDNLESLLKTKKIDGFWAVKSKKLYTHQKLQDSILDYALRRKRFRLEDAASVHDITIELVRRMLHELVKQGRLRGVFTQNREYMIDSALKEEISQIILAYRQIALPDLAQKIGITERTTEESIASLIARGELSGYIDLNTREFKYERPAPANPALYNNVKIQDSSSLITPSNPHLISVSTPPAGHDEKYVEVVREYDFIGGQVHFKVAIRNNSPAAIYDVKIVLDYPDAFHIDEEMITVPVIEPDSSRGVDFYLEPTTCGRSHVGATIIYKDFTAKIHTITVPKKEIWIKCPLVVSTMDTLEDVKRVIKTLPSDSRSFLISDIDARLAYHAGFRAISHFDARCVHAPEELGSDSFETEAYFATKAKNGGRIIIKLSVSEKAQILEIRVWCAEAGQLTGLLAKIIEYLFQEINVIRKIKEDSRERTIDLMAIAQGITVLSDYVLLHWKHGDIANKLEDIYSRLSKFLKDEKTLEEMEQWLGILRNKNKDDNIDDEVAEHLSLDIDRWHDIIKRAVAPA
ncbi:MAG: PCI domain-containing protein [Promethearchaeota archaeon]